MRGSVWWMILGLMGCACGETDPGVASAELAVTSGCTRAFAPDPELRLPALTAAEHWSKATGCAITVGDDGVPIVLVDSIERPDGSHAAGATSEARDLVRIDVHHAHKTSALLHEMGHALGGDHVASRGVLSGEKGRSDVIDAEALASVCSRLPCVAIIPEAP